MRLLALLVVLAAFAAAEDAVAPPPLKALLVTGGGWHDYQAIAPVLTERVSAYANVTWEVKWGLEPLKDPGLGEGFDVVVYDLCFTQGDDQQLIDNVLRVTRAGKPTVLRHCAMHCFRDLAGAHQAWAACCGMDTTSHDAFRAVTTAKADPRHPALRRFPDAWTTPGDELYRTEGLGPDAHPLLQAVSPESGRTHTVCWTSRYGTGRVFGTTLGHDLQTIGLPEYQRLLADGILWACGKLADDGTPAAGYARDGAAPAVAP